MPRRLVCLLFLWTLTACASTPDLAPAAPARPVSTPRPRTAAPVPSSVPTPTLTYRQAIFPYTVEGLRQRGYQSGSVTVVGLIEETKDFASYLIEYPSDGLNIRGVMQIPTRGEPPWPVIVMNHGWFSRSVFRSGDGTARAAEYLNTRGYLTIAPDYRSWGTSDVGPSLFYSGLAIDVVNLLLAIPSIPQADAARVGLWGHSMGGAVTMKALTIVGENPSMGADPAHPLVRAAVLYSTVSADQADALTRWGPGCFGDILAGESRMDCNSSDALLPDLPAEVLAAYSRAAGDPDMLKLVSPINYLEYVTVPVQINYGTWDGEELSGTPPEWSVKLARAFLDAGKPVKLIAYEEQRHSFVNEAWYRFMENAAKFFDQYVKN
ncbi:MAG: hypothetical protein PGMFKBFP_00090 [Anaerolineales bacterium]|nr:hypothetical protein [Anaerolineales bacterium]